MSPVAKLSAIPAGTTHKVVVDRRPILLCNVGGQIFAIEDVCTHDGGELDQGELDGTRIMCPRHGAIFDVTNGAALTPPAVMPVATYRVRVDGDDIYLDD